MSGVIMKKRASILFLLVPIILSAQNYVELYSDYLPQNVGKNAVLTKLVNTKADYFARLDPDLIYFYLNYLDLYMNQSIMDKDANSLSYLDYREEKAWEQKNEWSERELRILDGLDINGRLRRTVASIFNFGVFTKSAEDTNSQVPYNIDNNMKNFYVCRYYTGNRLIYDPAKDYQKIRQEYEENYLTRIVERYHTGKFSDNPEMEIDTILVMWKSISEANLKDFSSSGYICDVMMSEFSHIKEKNMMRGLGALILNGNNKPVLAFERPDAELDLSEYLPYTRQLEAVIGFEYSFYLKDYYDMFSYIKIGLRASKYLLASDFDIEYTGDPFRYTTPDHTFDYTMKDLTISGYGSETYLLGLWTPVLYATNHLNADLGLIGVYSRQKFEANYRFEVIRDGNQVSYTNYYTDQVLSDKWSVSPGIDIIYRFDSGQSVSAEAFYNRDLMVYIMAGYNF